MAQTKTGNPAVVGLAGFGLSTFFLQLVNVGLVESIGPALWLGIFGGAIAQFIAGLHCQSTGDNFGYSVFCVFGVFWSSFASMLLANELGFMTASLTDMGWFNVPFFLYSLIIFYAALHRSLCESISFGALLVGQTLIMAAHFIDFSLMVPAGYVMMIPSLLAIYSLAAILLADVCERQVLPFGPAPLKKGPRQSVPTGIVQPAE